MGKIRNFFAGLWNKASKGALSKGAIIAIAASATVAVAGGVTAGVILNTPEVVAANAVKGFVEDFFERDEFETVTNMLEKGSMEFSMSELSNGEEDLMEDIAVSGKLYFSPKAYMLENMKIESEYININGSLYLSDKEIYISEDEIIDGTYGGKYTELAKQLKNEDCIFNPESGSEFALPQETFDLLVETLETPNDEQMAKDAEKIIKNYVEKLYKIICEHAEFEAENDKVKVGGKKTSVRVITITIDGEAAANILTDFYDFAVEDDQIVKFLEKYEDEFEPIAKNYDEDKTMAELYEEALEDLEESIEDEASMLEEDDESEIAFEIVTPTLSSKLLQFSVEADGEKQFTLDVSKDGIKDSKRISLSVYDSYEDDLVEVFLYEIDANDSKAYEATLTVSDVEVLTIEIDRKNDEFEIVIDPENEGAVVSGTIAKKSKTTTIVIETIEADGMEITTDLKLVIKESDKIPAAPKNATGIDEITEGDIFDWASAFEDMVG